MTFNVPLITFHVAKTSYYVVKMIDFLCHQNYFFCVAKISLCGQMTFYVVDMIFYHDHFFNGGGVIMIHREISAAILKNANT